jgi:hypothetical protein
VNHLLSAGTTNQPEAFALCDMEWGDVFLAKVNDFFSRHGVASAV